jgi:D-serine deaminase-like pyridoxal phosphate-dependent protein
MQRPGATGRRSYEQTVGMTAFDPTRLRTPALVVSAGAVDANVECVLGLLAGTDVGWRPHVKTAKLAWTMQRLLDHGLTSLKCATPRELEVLCGLGARDVLVAFPHGAANAAAVQALAAAAPATRVSALVDDPRQVAAWRAPVSLFVDLDVGMGRGGIPVADVAAVAAAVEAVEREGLRFRGFHVYDGHLGGVGAEARDAAVAAYLAALAGLVPRFHREGLEVVTSGTPTFLAAARRSGLAHLGCAHSVAPGTVTYADLMTLATHPGLGLRPAATVVARVVSERPARLILDAGSKAVSVDQGLPHCAVVGHPALEPERPSEEHLPVAIPLALADPAPRLGDLLELVPRHVCTTVANFDEAIVVERSGELVPVPVDARGRSVHVPERA